MITIGILVFVYVMSAIAVAIWDKIVSETEVMSWVDNTQIFTPVYNTIVAIQLWRDFNPLRKK